MITIQTNQKLDEDVYQSFSHVNVGGVDFGKKIFSTHPGITPENYREYISDFYTANKDLFETNIHELAIT